MHFPLLNALLFDDEIDTGGTITSAAEALKAGGAKEVYACTTHPIFSGGAVQKLHQSPIRDIVATNTVPVTSESLNGKITVLSISSLIGEAIHRIHNHMSVGAMFEKR